MIVATRSPVTNVIDTDATRRVPWLHVKVLECQGILGKNIVLRQFINKVSREHVIHEMQRQLDSTQSSLSAINHIIYRSMEEGVKEDGSLRNH